MAVPAYPWINENEIVIGNPDIPAIEEWLRVRGIVPKKFEVVDVSDISSIPGPWLDEVLGIEFDNANDALLFKMTWVDK